MIKAIHHWFVDFVVGLWSDMVISTIELGISILRGGNIAVQNVSIIDTHTCKCIDGLMQDLGTSSALAMKILQFCINSLRPSDAYMRRYSNQHWFR